MLMKVSLLKELNNPIGEERYAFYCPGCKHYHVYTVPRWSFNGDLEKPTFRPSLLNTKVGVICHLYMTDGQIDFLSDCSHELAGITVDMEDES